MAISSKQFVISLLCLGVALYILRRVISARRRGQWDEDDDVEYYDGKQPAGEPVDPNVGDATTADAANTSSPFNLQEAIDFSDVTVSDKQRQEYQELQENTTQVQTVNERFNAAKRKTEEHGLRPGILTNKKRRQLVEALVRRPFCGRRTRSWRTEFSDSLRGDVIPRNKDNAMGMMRIGRSDPSVDLHPGALGPMSGLSGQWVSEENLPENVFEDLVDEAV